MIHPTLTTERLVLAPYALGDVDELHRVMRDPVVMQHIGKGALNRSEVHGIVVRAIAAWNATGMGWWSIRRRRDGYLIGQICLRPARELPDVEVGYGMDAAFWRQGYGREALEGVVAYGFAEKALPRIVATVRPENVASRALLQRCGFVQQPDIFLRNKTLCLYVRSAP